jgi:hypothetical protein
MNNNTENNCPDCGCDMDVVRHTGCIHECYRCRDWDIELEHEM